MRSMITQLTWHSQASVKLDSGRYLWGTLLLIDVLSGETDIPKVDKKYNTQLQ